MSEQDQSPDSQDENKLIAERRAKLDAIREKRNAFPNDFRRTAEAGDLQQDQGRQRDINDKKVQDLRSVIRKNFQPAQCHAKQQQGKNNDEFFHKFISTWPGNRIP